MKLVIREKAADDLDGIYDWIAKDSVRSAARVVRALRQRMKSILWPELVHIGRPGRKEGQKTLYIE